MTGRDDAAAMEAAELQDLRRRAGERRRELGDTLEALTAKLAGDTDMRRWARRGVQRATAGLGRAGVAGARRALPGPGTAAAAAGALRRAGGGRGSRAAAIALPAGLVLAAGLWWLTYRRHPVRRGR